MASIFLNNQIFQIAGDFILETIMCFSKTELLSHASRITQAHLEEVTSEFIKDENTGQNPTGQNPTLTKPHQLFSVKDKTPLFSFSLNDNFNDHNNFI